MVVAMVLLTAFVLGVLAGVLSWVGGTPVPFATLTGFAAFGGTATFIITAVRFAVRE
jgi:hypothetical protein